MRTDGVFTVRESRIELKRNESFQLVPFGDLHSDSPHFASDKWREFLEHMRSLTNPKLLGMGDYFDGYSTSERRIIYNPDLHESTINRLEAEGKARVRKLAKELAPFKGKFLGLMGGNHYQLYRDGSTSDTYLCKLLDTRYLGSCCALKLVMNVLPNHRFHVDVFAHHGRGGGRTAAGRFNSVEQLASVCEADIYLMGDNHARGVFPAGERMRILCGRGGPFVRSRKTWIGRTGSFLKAYVDNEASYIVDAAMPPASLGWIEFEIKVHREMHDGLDEYSVQIRATQ